MEEDEQIASPDIEDNRNDEEEAKEILQTNTESDGNIESSLIA